MWKIHYVITNSGCVLYSECMSFLCVCQCTCAQLLGSVIDAACLTPPPPHPESHPTDQWQSRSMNQWADIVETHKVHTAGLKGGQESLKHTHTSSNTQTLRSLVCSRQINTHLSLTHMAWWLLYCCSRWFYLQPVSLYGFRRVQSCLTSCSCIWTSNTHEITP